MKVLYTDGKPRHITTERFGKLESKLSLRYQTAKKQEETIYADLFSANQARGKEGEVIKVETLYRLLVLSKMWDALGKFDSIFYQGGQAQRHPDSVCRGPWIWKYYSTILAGNSTDRDKRKVVSQCHAS